jgi:hypothetical protein
MLNWFLTAHYGVVVSFGEDVSCDAFHKWTLNVSASFDRNLELMDQFYYVLRCLHQWFSEILFSYISFRFSTASHQLFNLTEI